MSKIKNRKHKINGEVRFPEVRILGDYDGAIMSSYDASKIAEDEGKDLILISDTSNPPVVRIEEYTKFLYNIEQKEKAARKNSKRSEMRELTFSANIADHDLGIKSKKAIEFLENGDKVKCSLMMKGRQLSMKEQGQIVMLKFAKLVEETGVPESLPKFEGSRWLMTLRPVNKK